MSAASARARPSRATALPLGTRSAYAAELLGTFVLVLFIVLGVLVLAPVTGAAINPARALGPLLVGDFGSFGDFLVAYVAGPILGALAAAALYTGIVLKPQDRIEERPIDTLS
jgi:glycerol uptake facilitator-like aquaporin